MQTKKQNLGLIGRCLFDGALALNSCGCDSTGEMYPSTAGTIGAASLQQVAATDSSLTPSQAQGFGLMGGLLGALSQQEAMREAGREASGRGNVIAKTLETKVGDVPKETNKQKSSIDYYKEFVGTHQVFFHTYYNEDGKDGWSPEEFIGIKSIFSIDEPIRAVSIWGVRNQDLNGKRVTLDIAGLDTNKIIYSVGEIERDPDNIIRSGSGEMRFWATHYLLSPKEIKEKIGGEKFRAYWNLDTKPVRSGDFIIR